MENFYTKYNRHMPDFKMLTNLPNVQINREEAILSLIVVLGSSISLVGLIFAFITYRLLLKSNRCMKYFIKLDTGLSLSCCFANKREYLHKDGPFKNQLSKTTFQKATSICMLGLLILISNCFAVIVNDNTHRNDIKDWIRTKSLNTGNNVIINFENNTTSPIPDCEVECTTSDAQPDSKNICDVLSDLQRYCTNETTMPAKKPTCSLKCLSNDTNKYCSYVKIFQKNCNQMKNKTIDTSATTSTSPVDKTPTTSSAVTGHSLMVNSPDKFNECSSSIRCTRTNCCSTPNCMELATHMCAVMNVRGEPCEDFHNFSCGGLAQDFNIADVISDQIHNLISEQRNSFVFLEAVDSLKNYYKSCLDEDDIRSESLEYVQRLIYSLGGWGVLQNTSYSDKFSEFDWNTYVQGWIKYGLYPDDLLFFDFENHNELTDKRNISALPPRLSLPVEILLEGKNNEIVTAYFNFMKDVATLLGADTKIVEKEMEEILNLEINLAHAKAEFEKENFDGISTIYEESVVDMTHRFPAINWWSFLMNFCHNLKQSDCFLKHYGAYKMKKLVDVITQASERSLNNYVVWKAIAKVGVFASPQINEIFHKYFSNMSITFAGTYIDKKCILSKGRWICNCIEITKQTFSKALNYLYANRYLDEISNQAVVKISDQIKDYFVTQITQWKTNNQRSEEESKEFIKNKLTNLTTCFYDDLMNIDELRSYYSSVPMVNTTNFLYWFQSMNLFHATKYVDQGKNGTATNRATSTCKGQFYFDSSIGRYGGVYLPWEATNFIGLRIMQSTQFDPYLPEYINLARIGFYIARLMALVIFKADSNDEYLSLRENVSLWDLNIMMKNDICVKKQSSELSLHFQDDGISSKFINSRATMEVILDDVAFTAAYDTYVALSKNKKNDNFYLLVPGFENYTTNEIFWMNFGTSICQLRDELDTSRVRVLMAATKHDEFRVDYVCSKNSKMSSQLQCQDLWSLLKEENR